MLEINTGKLFSIGVGRTNRLMGSQYLALRVGRVLAAEPEANSAGAARMAPAEYLAALGSLPADGLGAVSHRRSSAALMLDLC